MRRKADGARDSVRQFIDKWKRDPRVRDSEACIETAAALEELGQYYMRRGQRAALDRDSAVSILAHLAAAEAALPQRVADTGLLSGLLKGFK